MSLALLWLHGYILVVLTFLGRGYDSIKGEKSSNHRTHLKISSNLFLHFRLVDCPSFPWEFLRSYWIQLIGLQICYQFRKRGRFCQKEGKILQTCLESLLCFLFSEYLIIMFLTIPLPFWRKFVLVEFSSIDGVSSCSARLWSLKRWRLTGVSVQTDILLSGTQP